MRASIRLIVAIPLLALALSNVANAQTDTVSVGSADMLLITHDNLRTANWYPGMNGAWETMLLDQKASQGISVALYQIGNGVSASTIRTYVQSNGSNLTYVLIVGDADHPDVDPDNPTWPTSNASTKHFVPLYGQIVASDYRYFGDIVLENDLGYVDGLDGVSIGRIPAANSTEIINYLNKAQSYLEANGPNWATKNLVAMDDIDHIWTCSQPSATHRWARDIWNILPSSWSKDTLFTSAYANQAAREDAFLDQINNGVGLITTLGTASHMDNLNYFLVRESELSVTNEEMYPLVLGFNCSVGAIQRPDFVETDVIPWHYYYDNNIIEQLLLYPDAGIVGAIAPSSITQFMTDGYEAVRATDYLVNYNVRSFGGLWKSLVALRDSENVPYNPAAWQFENLLLLGDPSLRYPLGLSSSGHWTMDASPVIVTDSLHILNGDSLIIDAGVQVLFDQGACLVVDPGAKLIVNGTASDNVVFDRKDNGETWKGIFVNGGQLDMEWADFYHAMSYTVHTSAPAGSNTPVLIDHCYFNGADQVAGGVVLLLWDSPTLTHKVTNSTVENVPNGNGLYLYNAKADFQGDTIRGCSYINSYIKKVTGSFRSCVFEGRVSNYSVMTNMATCIPNFQCCTFHDLAPASGSFMTSIFCAQGTVPTFGGEGFAQGVSNVTDDSSAYLFVIEGSGTLPVIDYNGPSNGGYGGRNDWKQRKSTGKLIEWRNRTSGTYKCESQYWSTTPVDNLFTPTGAFDYSPHATSAYELCGGSGNGDPKSWDPQVGRTMPSHGRAGLDEGEEDLYGQALALEDSGQYAEALDLFHTVAVSSADQDLRWYATTHVVTSEAFVGTGTGWVPALIDSLIETDDAYNTRVYGNRVLASHYLNHQAYQAAIDVCADLLNSSLTYTDSIYVSIDLLSIEMAAGLIPFGGLDAAMNIPTGLQVSSLAEGLALENNLLNLLGSGSKPNTGDNLVPKAYRLYQNYPNPFNPTTEIRFDLPENAKVELRVFNTLGQLVTTLVNEDRQAGAYRVLWDGQSATGQEVAAGLYIYQLKAGSFTSAKKMALIK